MDSNCPNKNSTSKQNKFSLMVGRKSTLIFLSVFLGLLLLFAIISLATTLYSKTIYPNVIMLGTDVGGYSKEKLSSFLETELSTVFSNMELTI